MPKNRHREKDLALIDQMQKAGTRGYLTDLFGAGTDTTTKIMEWTMAELIHNPEKMKHAQNKLDKDIN